ncbi:HAD family hydrolase [Methylovorus sp. MM2]|uniref:TIGR01458 family HAD-type hydrolase n=1 Tax=Methylovorus sp. MM2 TaxID=1848038 RepID=UPI0007DEFB54|nr:TIGR01458 family HAD-type hydrolase [Methylovorus sp. MM2]OAM52750.1 HAD family hydrolase [Methylovorus sp. MM2]
MKSVFKAVLFDLDGVLYVDNTVVEGAIEAVKKVRAAGIPCRFLTNTSTLSLKSLQEKINAMGFNIKREEIFSAPQAALLYLSQRGDPVCRLLLADDVKKDFSGFRQSDTKPDYIVIGDIGDAWSYSLMNEIFTNLMDGAKLIAIHKNRFWQTEQGLKLDIGSFIAGLEYASGTSTMIIGKPSNDFFKTALEDLEVSPIEVLMVGDDIDSDIGGAHDAGIHAVLVKTGKYRQEYVDKSAITPDWVFDSIADLPGFLGIHS